MNGTVKWFDPRKGYGFILGEDGMDYFVHYTAIVQEEGFRTPREKVTPVSNRIPIPNFKRNSYKRGKIKK